jgi:hypothetical protein
LPSAHPPTGRLRALAEGWQRFWFTPADPTVLGLIRIFAGLMLVYVHVLSGLQLQELFGAHGWLDVETANLLREQAPVFAPPDGWDDPMPEGHPLPGWTPGRTVAYRKRWSTDPSVTLTRGAPTFSLWFHLTDPAAMQAAHWVMLVIAVLFTLGVATRVTAVLAWFTALCYIHRITLGTFGMDTMLALVLLYLMLSPCGAALSVDRLIARYRVALSCLARHRPVPPLLRPAPRVSANFALRLLQIHFCIIYLASGTSKLQGPAWHNGSALWQTITNYEFAGPPPEMVTNGLRFLSEHRWLWELAMNAGAYFTLALEIGLPILIWFPRWRGPLICAAAALHTGIALMMGGLGVFSVLMLTILASFIPPEVVHRFLERIGHGRARLWLVFARVPRQIRAAALAHAFDFWGQLRDIDPSATVRPPDAPNVSSAPCLQLVGADGEAHTGYALFGKLARSLRILWPVALLLRIPGVSRLGRALVPGNGKAGAAETVTAGQS